MKTILCPYYKNHKCILVTPENSDCYDCDRNPDKSKCALECAIKYKCERETCNIGKIIIHD